MTEDDAIPIGRLLGGIADEIPPRSWVGGIHPRAIRAKSDEMDGTPRGHLARLLNEIGTIIELCESPIEQVALYHLAGQNYSFDEDNPRSCCFSRSEDGDWPNGVVVRFVPQVEMGPYRIDLLGVLRSGRRFALEFDGEAYHEAERDALRDRQLREDAGIEVLRIDGKSIWRSAVWASGVAAYVGGIA